MLLSVHCWANDIILMAIHNAFIPMLPSQWYFPAATILMHFPYTTVWQSSFCHPPSQYHFPATPVLPPSSWCHFFIATIHAPSSCYPNSAILPSGLHCPNATCHLHAHVETSCHDAAIQTLPSCCPDSAIPLFWNNCPDAAILPSWHHCPNIAVLMMLSHHFCTPTALTTLLVFPCCHPHYATLTVTTLQTTFHGSETQF